MLSQNLALCFCFKNEMFQMIHVVFLWYTTSSNFHEIATSRLHNSSYSKWQPINNCVIIFFKMNFWDLKCVHIKSNHSCETALKSKYWSHWVSLVNADGLELEHYGISSHSTDLHLMIPPGVSGGSGVKPASHCHEMWFLCGWQRMFSLSLCGLVIFICISKLGCEWLG